MINLNTNLSSQIVQQSMSNATKLLNLSVEQMTTGYKLNHAKDNAANYSISTNMTTKIGAYDVVEDNAAMGLDLISTAEGTLTQIQDKLERLRALQEQASNGTYGEQSLKAINAEANALIDEIERLYSTTEYNGINLFGEIQGGFIQEITRRDTSSMTKLSSVDETQALTSGTYSISTAEELAQLATMTNNGLIAASTEFVLANDIDLSAYSSGEGWTPIGTDNDKFLATFDGNGNEIINLYINRPTASFQGLFGNAEAVELKNIILSNVNITGQEYVGGLGGVIATDINNCSVSGTVNGVSLVGGLGGYVHDNEVADCNAYAKVICTTSYTGGFVGYAYNSTIKNCYSNSDVFARSARDVGGLIGHIESSTIENCYSTGDVFGNLRYAGFIGYVYTGSISNSYTTNKLFGNISEAGAFVGLVDSSLTVSNSSYYSSINKGVAPIKTGGDAITSDMLLDKISQSDTKFYLQVGINSDTSSSIGVETVFVLKNINTLRSIGKNSTIDYLSKIDDILAQVSEKQTHFGAVSNRLESVLEEITIQRDNLVSSRSTIRDADIAEVSSQYIQQQILQEASATLLATANQSPSIALGLI